MKRMSSSSASRTPSVTPWIDVLSTTLKGQFLQEVAMKVGRETKIWHPEKSVILDCTIGRNCTVHAPVWIGHRVSIGDYCKIQAFAFIPTGVRIAHGVFIGPHVCFTNDKHPPSEELLTTIVASYVTIGAGAIILPGITIGKGAKIGAGSVVTKNVPEGEVWVGNPARKLEG